MSCARTWLTALRVATGVATALGIMLGSCTTNGQTIGDTNDMPFVAVTQLVGDPTLNVLREGIKDELLAAGYEIGTTLRWEWRSAKGSPATARQIATKYAQASPDVIVAIANPNAKLAAAVSQNIPIVFSAVGDPVAAELVSDLDRPGDNISGVSDRLPIPQQLALIKEIVPTSLTLGIIYDVEQGSTSSLVSLINQSALEQDLAVQAVTVLSPDETAAAARGLVGSVDAIYIPPGSTPAALETIVRIGRNNKLPVFAGDVEAVESGAIATLSFDYYDVGRQTGEMIVQVLAGKNPGDLPVEFVEDLQLTVNQAAADAVEVQLPSTVIFRVDRTIE
ncbi:conserved hypothetical protein [Synechococcus sp. PCC 7335]|uniref:ABC transporter substrate-binding protein n=1 Tax=Synechococcus sp. (strain ATCC 29403 / PCC 7335) TaxID=91464 RepID=UPI00017ECAA3|nr:ABC transporter substrate-binding protein [Synechococcus sp. PCC 7335]EDX87891.1 conserved hypothetical protein [Synechococcus sp. PCC 7335]